MANAFRKEPDKLNKQYQEELRTLIEKTGKSQRELRTFAPYFQIRETDRQSGLSESTFTRTLQNIPSKNGVYNLMTILGVLYLLGQIDRSKIEKIIEKYEIPVPGEDSWDRIFEQIELGVQRGREAAIDLDDGVPIPPRNVTKKSRDRC